MKWAIPFFATAAALGISTTPLHAQSTNRSDMEFTGYVFEQLKWEPAPTWLPSGSEMSILEGSPTDAGPYTIRLKLPAGYRIPTHWGAGDEHITVISGLLHIGTAPSYDKSTGKSIGAHSFALIPANMKHADWTDEE